VDVHEARGCFPGLTGKVFLDAACVSLAPMQAAEAVAGFLQRVLTCPERDSSSHHVALDALRRPTYAEAALLLEAHEDEIALVESTTHGLNVAAQAIPFRPEDNVVICDLEFLQTAIPWVKLREEGRIAEVRLARNVNGTVPVESIAALVDGRTRAVVVSSVQWCNGYRLDLAALSALCRERGVLLVVNAIHQLGAVRLSVRETPVDILVAGGHKWLNSPFGCGLMYVSRETLPGLRQPMWGYLGLAEPDGGWPRYFATPEITPLREYEFPLTARRFELNGTSNYPGAIALGASLKLVNEIGIEAVTARVLELAEQAWDGLAELGVRVVTPRDPATRSGITTFQVSADPAENEAFLQRLLDERIYLAMRYTSGVGGIRVSTHYFNDEEDLAALFAAVRRLLPAARRVPLLAQE
jgi:selenocysteine lyase/cysteine desulfurase